MTNNIDHTTDTLDNGTVRHIYTSGPFKMTVFDRRESKSSAPSHIKIRANGHTYIRVGVMPGLDLSEPDYLLETGLPSRPCDLGILIEDATIARCVLDYFRWVLLNDHQITTTLNGK